MKQIINTNKPAKINNLKELVEMNAADYGDKPLYYYRRDKEVLSFTYNMVKQSVDRLGTAFSELGIMGKNIAVIGDADPYYMVTYFAAANGGGAIVPLDKELDNGTIASFMNIAEVKLIVYTRSFNERMPEIAGLSDALFFVPIVPDPDFMPDDSFVALDTLLEKGKAAIDNGNDTFTSFVPQSDAVASMIFTSGTTGTSKCVMLSQKNLASCCNACVDATNFFPENTFVSVLPMNHSYEVSTGHLALSRYGACTFLNDSIKNALRNFAYFKPTSLLLVPLFVETIHKRIWKEIDRKRIRKKVNFAIRLSNFLRKIGIDKRRVFFKDILAAFGGNLETIVCGGAPLSKQLIIDFEAFGIDIYEGYGITECSPLVSVNRYGRKKYGSVGTAVLDCKVRIDKTPDEETGEILVKGDNVMLGYYKNPEADKDAFTEDGWFRTGDIGYIDSDGYIFITGRKKNVIILSNGKNVFPEELEEHLSHKNIIGESVVLGRKDAESGETVITAVIYPNPEETEGKESDEIYALVKQAVDETNKSLPTFKHILAFEIRDTEFEKTTTKKIKRFLVK